MKCTDKIAYDTRGEAWQFARTVRRRNGSRGGVYIYECKFCRRYHITHIRPERWKWKLTTVKKYNFRELTR